MVGKIAAYEAAALASQNPELSELERTEAAQEAVGILGDIANKEINQEVVAAVNDLLGITPADDDSDDSGTDSDNTDNESAT